MYDLWKIPDVADDGPMNMKAMRSTLPPRLRKELDAIEPVETIMARLAAMPLDEAVKEADVAKAWISEDLEARLDESEMTKSELARRLGTSRQHVGEIIKEQANLTIETMAKLSAALDCRLVVRIIPKGKHMPVLDVAEYRRFCEWRDAEAEKKKPVRKAPARKAAVGVKKVRVKSAQH